MTHHEWAAFAATFPRREADLLLRSYQTIMNNVYAPDAGYRWSPYRCITPSMHRFTGIWNWDSAFHAIGVSRWDTALAQESIVGFLQFQRPDGLLPDVIFESGGIVNTFSKPPVFAFAAETVFRRGGDCAFLQTVYPPLAANAAYWEAHRQTDGLFYYDADNPETDDYLTRVKYESGWDNSPRWDNGITRYWAIDLNCFMVLTYLSLAYLANELGLADEAAGWQHKATVLASLINRHLWDKTLGAYVDTDRFTGEHSTVLTPASFMPLYLTIASPPQAESMRRVAGTHFESRMPTVAFDNPAYSDDYWRGPTWLNVAYFAAKGLKNYGFAVADTIKDAILAMCDNEKSGIYENYDSRTGKGLCCDCFSWSCVFLNEFILNF